jgi:hypothetical protein
MELAVAEQAIGQACGARFLWGRRQGDGGFVLLRPSIAGERGRAVRSDEVLRRRRRRKRARRQRMPGNHQRDNQNQRQQEKFAHRESSNTAS